MLISNKLHSFRNFLMQSYKKVQIVRLEMRMDSTRRGSLAIKESLFSGRRKHLFNTKKASLQ